MVVDNLHYHYVQYSLRSFKKYQVEYFIKNDLQSST